MEQEYIKHEKLKLHIKYILGISISIIAIVIIASCYWNSKFVDEVSFAGTISSIILSVIAIIMTIVGEQKSDNTKNKLENVSDNLIEIKDDISKEVEKLMRLLENTNNNMINLMENSIQDKFKNGEKDIPLSGKDDVADDIYIKFLELCLRNHKNDVVNKSVVCGLYWLQLMFSNGIRKNTWDMFEKGMKAIRFEDELGRSMAFSMAGILYSNGKKYSEKISEMMKKYPAEKDVLDRYIKEV